MAPTVATVLLLGACSPASPRVHPHAARTPVASSGSAPVLGGSIIVDGGFNVIATFTAPAMVDRGDTLVTAAAGSSCAQYADGFRQPAGLGGGRGFDAPTIQTHTGGVHDVYVSVSMRSGYGGPGTYTSTTSPLLQGRLTAEALNAEGGAFTIFTSRIHGSTTLTVYPSGSGELRISRWGSDETKGGAGTVSVDAVITWSCR